MTASPAIEHVRRSRAEVQSEIDRLVSSDRPATASENRKIEALVRRRTEFDGRLVQLEDEESRREKVAEGQRSSGRLGAMWR